MTETILNGQEFSFSKKKKGYPSSEAPVGKTGDSTIDVEKIITQPDLFKQIDNEWNKPEANLQALTEVKIPSQSKYSNDRDITSQISKEINRQFETNDVDIDSKQAQFFTQICKKMIAGTEVANIRVFILKKGQTVNAFAFPDGTIFITQALLNRLDTIDEIGSILAHEVGHVLNKTSITESVSGFNSLGVGWAHETSSDLLSVSLLEKAGLNSNAFISAISKIQDDQEQKTQSRGDVVHQSSNTRAVEVKLAINKLDSNTSLLAETPKDTYDFLQNQEVAHTNLEIFNQAYLTLNESLMHQTLENMAASDLANLTSTLDGLWQKRANEYQNQLREEKKAQGEKGLTEKDEENEETFLLDDPQIKFLIKTQRVFEALVLERLQKETQTTSAQAQSLLLLNQAETRNNHLSPLSKYQDVDELLSAIDNWQFWSRHFESNSLSDNLSRIFTHHQKDGQPNNWSHSRDGKIIISYSYLDANLQTADLYNFDAQKNSEGKFFVSPAQFYQIFDKIEPYLETNSIKKTLEEASYQYLQFYFAQPEKSPFSSTDLINFLIELKNRGILVTEDSLKRNFSFGIKGIPVVLREALARIDNKDLTLSLESQLKQLVANFVETFQFSSENNEGQGNSSGKKIKELSIRIKNLLDQAQNEQISPDLINQLMREIKEKLAGQSISPRRRILDPEQLFSQDLDAQPTTLEQAENQQVFEFKNALFLFESFDCRKKNQDVTNLNKFLTESNLDFSQYDWRQLTFLLQGLWMASNSRIFLPADNNETDTRSSVFFTSSSLSEGRRFYNQTQLESLTPIKILLEKINQDFQPATTLSQFLEQTSRKQDFLRNFTLSNPFESSTKKSTPPLFQDRWQDVMFWQNERLNLQDLIAKLDFKTEDHRLLPDLIQVIEQILPEEERLKVIIKKLFLFYLQSAQVDFPDKLNFFLERPELGLEGAEILAEQISDLADYQEFQQKIKNNLGQWQKDKTQLTELALVDFATSFGSQQFADLFKTTYDENGSAQTQQDEFVYHWLSTYSDNYDDRLEKFSFQRRENFSPLAAIGQNEFKSATDHLDQLKNLDKTKRALIVNKMLNDENGALSSQENRVLLAEIIKKIVADEEDDFTAQIAELLVKNGKTESISLLLIALLSPLLFQNFQNQKLDFASAKQSKRSELIATALQGDQHLSEKDIELLIQQELSRMEREEHEFQFSYDLEKSLLEKDTDPEFVAKINKILQSSTRNLAFFGSDFINNPDSQVARIAQISDQVYENIFQTLSFKVDQLTKEPDSHSVENKSVQNQKMESLITGVEAGGAITVRQMQLATQFIKFDADWQERLSHTLDSNPGLSKLEAWQNLYHWAIEVVPQSEAEKQQQAELKDFLEHHQLGRKLGGGSLNTIFEIKTKDETGPVMVIRIQNPNVAANVRSTYELLHTAYTELAQNPRRTKDARIGMLINDLAQRWCLEDINDPNFVADDSRFRQVLNSFTPSDNRVHVSAPEIGLTQAKVKIEQMAPGKTLNKLAIGQDIDEVTKNTLRRTFCEFFLHQLDFDQQKITSDSGHEYIIVHSDQHMGNYMADVQEDGAIQFSVIDRNMYLHLEKEDVEIAQALIEGNKGGLDFVDKFVQRILDLNKIRGKADRISIKAKIVRKLVIDSMKNIMRGKKDGGNLNQLQIIFEQLALKGYDIPLNLQMMIRNVTAYKNIRQDFINSEARLRQ